MKLLICGDTVPTDLSAPLFAKGDVKTLFSDVADVFAAHDRVVVNLECALTETENRIRKCGPNLKGPTASAKTLKDAGVTDAGLANNHVLDFGVEGLHNTEKALDAAGIGWFGAGEDEDDAAKPYFMELGGKKIAFLSYNEHEYTYALKDQAGAAPFRPFAAMAQINAVKKQADYLIVLYHGGKEHCEYPSPRLHELCHAMIDLGADAVFCQHSHIIGCREEYNGGMIVYGQGNFHFMKYLDTPGWCRGLMTSIDVSDKLTYTFIPVEVKGDGIALMPKEEAEQVLADFEKRSESLKDGTWTDGWKAFVDSVSEMYTNVVKNAYTEPDNPMRKEHFSHYLDCEAHLDVFKELYQTWHLTKQDGAEKEM